MVDQAGGMFAGSCGCCSGGKPSDGGRRMGGSCRARRRRAVLPGALALVLHLAVDGAYGRSFEGTATDLILLTDAVDPPAVRALSTKTLEMDTIVSYTREDLAALGVPFHRPDGGNRTLRPASIVLLEERYSDTVFWTDAGAGAILGMRFDASGLRVLARGLAMPEALVLDRTTATYQLFGGMLLYFGDSAADRIGRCVIDFSVGGAGNCTRGVEDVLTGVGDVSGLALRTGETTTLYWANAQTYRVYSALIDPVTGQADVPATLLELMPYVTIPTSLALEPASSSSLNADRLYVLDQQKPTSLFRVWLNGNSTQRLLKYGLSRPRAIAVAPTHHFFCIADSGTKQLLLGAMAADAPALREAYSAAVFEPRGVAIRSDAEILISLTGGEDRLPGDEGETGEESAAPSHRALHARAAATAMGAAIVAAAIGLLV